MTAKRTAVPAILAVGLLAQGASARDAWAQSAAGGRDARGAHATAFAQARPQSRRARSRIRVYRATPYRRESTPYPTPYDVEFPGPGYVRQCSARLVPEYRLSGIVIVPVT